MLCKWNSVRSKQSRVLEPFVYPKSHFAMCTNSDGDFLGFYPLNPPTAVCTHHGWAHTRSVSLWGLNASKNKGIKISKWVFLTPYGHNFSEFPWWGSSAFFHNNHWCLSTSGCTMSRENVNWEQEFTFYFCPNLDSMISEVFSNLIDSAIWFAGLQLIFYNDWSKEVFKFLNCRYWILVIPFLPCLIWATHWENPLLGWSKRSFLRERDPQSEGGVHTWTACPAL